MIRVKAYLSLFKNDMGRETPFISGYRPLFNFTPEMKVSGQITLLDRDKFYPGDEGVVLIFFLNDEYLGDNFQIGSKFTFCEGRDIIGMGEVIEVMGRD